MFAQARKVEPSAVQLRNYVDAVLGKQGIKNMDAFCSLAVKINLVGKFQMTLQAHAELSCSEILFCALMNKLLTRYLQDKR